MHRPPNDTKHVHERALRENWNLHQHAYGSKPATLCRRSEVCSTVQEPIHVLGVPSVSSLHGLICHGDANSASVRSYTLLKVVGDGSFGTVWFVDWHGALPSGSISAMQCNSSVKSEWTGKRLVALKRMKKRWEGGWDECQKLKELESLRAIPSHANIIRLFDFFLLPSTKELYFVFEAMEGNLYQLIKSRKGRRLPEGLISSIFHQVVSGLHHIHSSGYFHRDMKPENLLVTTTGLFDYESLPSNALSGSASHLEKDVVVVVKLADFGLARETRSEPPYTEYVSTRWYRAPEVLLRSRDYSKPVDMWALGAIMTELINLRPLFPGQCEIEQITRICEVLGDPSVDNGVDVHGMPLGGGRWITGVRMAKLVGFSFPKLRPVPILDLFDRRVHPLMVECISGLLKYDPNSRLTSHQCLIHRYILETNRYSSDGASPYMPYNLHAKSSPPSSTHAPQFSSVTDPSELKPPAHLALSSVPSGLRVPSPCSLVPVQRMESFRPILPLVMPSTGAARGAGFGMQDATCSSRNAYVLDLAVNGCSCIGTSSSSHLPVGDFLANSSHTSGYRDTATSCRNAPWVDVGDPSANLKSLRLTCQQSLDTQPSSPSSDLPEKMLVHYAQNATPPPMRPCSSGPSGPSMRRGLKIGPLRFRKKNSKWQLKGMFAHGRKEHLHGLVSVDELPGTSSMLTPSFQSSLPGRTDSLLLTKLSHHPSEIMRSGTSALQPLSSLKSQKKEAERIALEAEKVRRALAERRSREQARAVMQKRNQTLRSHQGADIDWELSHASGIFDPQFEAKWEAGVCSTDSSSLNVDVVSGHFEDCEVSSLPQPDLWAGDKRTKARRRDADEDHTMSSSDIHNTAGVSVISFSTFDGDSHLAHPSLPRSSNFGSDSAGFMYALHTAVGQGDLTMPVHNI